ncbi:hypothetical protein BLA29_005181, partial [Euroglyphus maynei]
MEQHRIFRILLNTVGFLGIQLRPFIWSDSISILNWSLNIVINLLTLYVLNNQKPFHQRLERLMTSDQYLMYYFIKTCGLFVFPGICLSYVITYLIYGHRILQYLQSSTFSSVRISHNSILFFIAVFMIPFFIFWLRKFIPFYPYDLVTFFAIEIVILYRSVTWILLSITKCRDLFEEMKDLAELNNRLQPIFSILTTIHLIYTSAVVTVALNDLAMNDFPINLWCIFDILYRLIFWFGLLTINRKVLQNFDRIEGSPKSNDTVKKEFIAAKMCKSFKIQRDEHLSTIIPSAIVRCFTYRFEIPIGLD